MNHAAKYIHETGTFFEEVQLSGIFPDNKLFPDCSPKGINQAESLKEIIIRYNEQKNLYSFDLKAFITDNFNLPYHFQPSFSDKKDLSAFEYIEAMWQVLSREPHNERSSLIPVPYPYLVPSEQFRELHYRDSYFAMLGLQAAGRTNLIQAMVDNFTYLLYKVGHIPHTNRQYCVGRSQPPFYALMVQLLSESKGLGVINDYLPYIEKEYEFWMEGKRNLKKDTKAATRAVKMPDDEVMNRYWDNQACPRPEAFCADILMVKQSDQSPDTYYRNLRASVESGWDFSSRWFQDSHNPASIHTTDIVPVDLNCLLLYMEEILATGYAAQKSNVSARKYRTLAQNRRNTIQKYCWNESTGFYHDFDFVLQKQKPQQTLAAVFPLFFNIATPSQAQQVAARLEAQFLKKDGLLTTIMPSVQCCDVPSGKASLQWMACKGLRNYGYFELARKIKANWIATCMKGFKETGRIADEYDVTCSGNESNHDAHNGYLWTAGLLLKMMKE